MADMTPTDKDAMALAAVDSAAHALKYAGAKHEGVQQVIDARAHLASRIADLEAERDEANERAARTAAQYQHEFEAHGQTIERAERAEAELAAVRANADRYLHLREANNADPTPFIAQRYEHGIMQWTGEEADAAIDAARGGE